MPIIGHMTTTILRTPLLIKAILEAAYGSDLSYRGEKPAGPSPVQKRLQALAAQKAAQAAARSAPALAKQQAAADQRQQAAAAQKRAQQQKFVIRSGSRAGQEVSADSHRDLVTQLGNKEGRVEVQPAGVPAWKKGTYGALDTTGASVGDRPTLRGTVSSGSKTGAAITNALQRRRA